MLGHFMTITLISTLRKFSLFPNSELFQPNIKLNSLRWILAPTFKGQGQQLMLFHKEQDFIRNFFNNQTTKALCILKIFLYFIR